MPDGEAADRWLTINENRRQALSARPRQDEASWDYFAVRGLMWIPSVQRRAPQVTEIEFLNRIAREAEISRQPRAGVGAPP
jgi:hypothetical protein